MKTKIFLNNKSTLDRKTVRRIIRFVLEHLPVMRPLSVRVKDNRTTWVGGHAEPYSSAVLLTIPKLKRLRLRPYQYAHLKGKFYWLWNRIEMLVYLAAHEIRHVWQGQFPKAGRYPNGKGKFSEVDTESFAIHILRAWRKTQ
jgi:hypothetical protein